MSPGAWKNVGVLCFIACPILLYLAWHFYQKHDDQLWLQDNASNRAEDERRSTSRTGYDTNGTELVDEYRTGAKNAAKAMKYALGFAALTAIGGIIATVIGRKKRTAKSLSTTTPPNP